MLLYFSDSEQPSAVTLKHGEKNKKKEKSTIASSDKWAQCLHTNRRLERRRDAITYVCMRDAWYTTITLHSKSTFSWQTRSLCFAPEYFSAAVCLHLSTFFFIYLSLLSTQVLCAVVSHQKGFGSNVFLSRLQWGVSLSGYPCRVCPYLHSLSVDILKAKSHVWRSRIANAPLSILSRPISPCVLRECRSRSRVHLFHVGILRIF